MQLQSIALRLALAAATLAATACRRDPWSEHAIPTGERLVPSCVAPRIEGARVKPRRTIDLLAADAPVARRYFKSRAAAPAGALELRDEALVCEFTAPVSGRATLVLEVEAAFPMEGVVWVKSRTEEGGAARDLELPVSFAPRAPRCELALWELAGDAPVHYVTIGPDLLGRAVRLRSAVWEEHDADLQRLRWIKQGEVSVRSAFVPEEAKAWFDLAPLVRRVRFAWAPAGMSGDAALWIEGRRHDGTAWREEALRDPSRAWSECVLDLPPGLENLSLVRSRGTGGFFLGEARLFDRPNDAGVPDLIVITADTLRADHLGCYGSTRTETPVIDALAARGTLFERLHTTVNMTNPSHASLFTSLYAKDHGVHDNRTRLADEATTLAEVLRERGYLCIAAHGAKHISAAYANLSQGFDRAAESPDWVRSAGRVNRGLEEALPLDAEEPLFVWAHYFDPHTPYGPPKPFDRKYYGDRDPAVAQGDEIPAAFLPELAAGIEVRDAEYPRAQYRAEVDYLDAEIGRFLERLSTRQRPRVLLFVADHGESLGENGIYFNHGGLVPQTMRVPCILVADRLEAARRETRVLSLIDLLPSLCELLDVQVPAAARGRSLLSLLRDPREEREVYFEHAHALALGRHAGDRYEILHRAKHRDADYRGDVEAGTTEIVLLRSPGLGEREVGAALSETARERLAAFAKDVHVLPSQPFVLDGQDAEAFRALGYAEGPKKDRPR